MMTQVNMLFLQVILIILISNVLIVDSVRMSVEESRQGPEVKQQTKTGDVKATVFSFAKHFHEHMVLQRAPAKANIHGWASNSDVGKKISLKLTTSSKPYSYETTIVDGPTPGLGSWFFALDPIEAGVNVTIEVEAEAGRLTLNDVIFGDVWICSGQSNMEFTVIQMLEAEAEIKDAHNYPNIRLMTVQRKMSATPLYELKTVLQNWTRPDNASVGGAAWSYFSAVCWLYGKAIHKALGIPIGLVATDWGGTPVEAWSSHAALLKCNVTDKTAAVQSESYKKYVGPLTPVKKLALEGPQSNSFLWNAMIHPLLNMTIYGAIWYQGEADADGAKMNRYNCTFPTMIKDWRTNFNIGSRGQTSDSFPFGFVQLAPDQDSPTVDTGFPDVRWHQTADWGFVPNPDMMNVFMAVALDLPDFNSTYGSVHPRDKKDVGYRLSLSGLAIAYGKTEMFQGPFPQDAGFTNEGIKIYYGDKWNLDVRNEAGFEVLCADGNTTKWNSVSIIASDNTSVTINWSVCGESTNVKGLRYLWRVSPCVFKKCAVYETVNSLPAPPFIALAPETVDGKTVLRFNRPTVY